jgi:CBS domain-containing protein/Flp pilus assembly pilin Flp
MNFPLNMQSAVKNFLRREHGAAMLENCLMLAVLAGGIYLVIDMVGGASSQASNRITAAMAGQSHNASSNAIVNGEASSAPPPAPLGLRQLTAQEALTVCPDCIPPYLQYIIRFQNHAAIFAIAIGTCLWTRIRNQRLRDEAAKKADDSTCRIPQALMNKRIELFKSLDGFVAAGLTGQMRVEHMMSYRLTCVAPETPIEEVKEIMTTNRIRHLLVLDHEETLVGIISDRDLKGRVGKKASDIMTKTPVTLDPTTGASAALSIMINKGISAVPVVDEGKVRGIVTTTDVMLTLQCAFQVLDRVGADLSKHDDAKLEAVAC